jgi:hypothetical protein
VVNAGVRETNLRELLEAQRVERAAVELPAGRQPPPDDAALASNCSRQPMNALPDARPSPSA